VGALVGAFQSMFVIHTRSKSILYRRGFEHKMIYIPKNKEQIEKLLSDGILEARESNEYCAGAKNELTKGMGNNKRKSQLKDLQSGTEKILKALWLIRGEEINKKDKKGILLKETLSLGNFISKLEKGDEEITKEDIDILNKINEANKIKHGIDYQINEIEGVRKLLDKLSNIVMNNMGYFIN